MTIGTCLCGAIGFEIEPPWRWFAHCHCRLCRRHHGSLFSTSLGVDMSRFRWLRGLNDIVRFRASPAFERPFCRLCGAKLPGVSQWPALINVPAGTLDGDIGARPRTHIFVGSRSSYCEIDDALPRFDGYPLHLGADPAPPPLVPGTSARLDEASCAAGQVSGGCLCGDAVYRISGELAVLADCCCRSCRKSCGAAYATHFLVAANRFDWVRGGKRLSTYAAPGSPDAAARFCARCGSAMPRLLQDYRVVAVPAGTLHAEPPLAPGTRRPALGFSQATSGEGLCSNAAAASLLGDRQ